MKEVVLVVLFVYFCLSFVIVRTMKPSLKKKLGNSPSILSLFLLLLNNAKTKKLTRQCGPMYVWTHVASDRYLCMLCLNILILRKMMELVREVSPSLITKPYSRRKNWRFET